MRRRLKPALTRDLEPETMVIATESFRPGAIARMVERGQWHRLDSPVVSASPEFFAVPLRRVLELEQTE